MHEIKDVIYVGVRKLRKPEKFRLVGIGTLTSATPVQRSKQLRYQANWELVIKFTREIHTNPDIFTRRVSCHQKVISSKLVFQFVNRLRWDFAR